MIASETGRGATAAAAVVGPTLSSDEYISSMHGAPSGRKISNVPTEASSASGLVSYRHLID